MIRYPYQQLQEMTQDDLVKIFFNTEKFNNYIKNKRITNVQLKTKSGGMSVNILTEDSIDDVSKAECLSG
jgi:hypothetical protein